MRKMQHRSPIDFLVNGINTLAQKYLPNALILAVGLCVLVFLAGIFPLGNSPMDMVGFFNSNMWDLLAFSMQTIMMIVLSTACMDTKPVQRLMHGITGIPKTPAQAILFGCGMQLVLFAVNSTFALVFGAVFAREIGRRMPHVNYPLLVAVCYCGYCTWQGGVCGVTPLQVATEGSLSAQVLGYTIPLSRTVLSGFNLAILFSLILTIPVLVAVLFLKRSSVETPLQTELLAEQQKAPKDYRCPNDATPAVRMEYSRVPLLTVAACMLLYLLYGFARRGIDFLDANTLNAVLLCVCLVFARNTRQFMDLVSDAMKTSAGVLVQFPIYAGLMGMVADSGLGTAISTAIVSHASAQTMPNICHLASTMLNLLVPSGGAQWAIEAPVYLPAAEALGAPVERVVMACAYGDALSNLIQPFWALPLLSITRLNMRDVMGYCVIICLWGLLCIQGVMFLFSFSV